MSLNNMHGRTLPEGRENHELDTPELGHRVDRAQQRGAGVLEVDQAIQCPALDERRRTTRGNPVVTLKSPYTACDHRLHGVTPGSNSSKSAQLKRRRIPAVKAPSEPRLCVVCASETRPIEAFNTLIRPGTRSLALTLANMSIMPVSPDSTRKASTCQAPLARKFDW